MRLSFLVEYLILYLAFFKTILAYSGLLASSETQRQIVGARENLNGWKNVAQRKVKNGEKSPWRQCLTRPVPNGRCRSGFFTFLHATFFHPFRLSLIPTICPWVSEDGLLVFPLISCPQSLHFYMIILPPNIRIFPVFSNF